MRVVILRGNSALRGRGGGKHPHGAAPPETCTSPVSPERGRGLRLGELVGGGSSSALPGCSCCQSIPCSGGSRAAWRGPPGCPPAQQHLPLMPPGSRQGSGPQGGFFLCISKDPGFASQAEGGQGMPLSFSPKALIPTIARSRPVLLSFPLPPSFEHLNLSLSKQQVFSKPIFLLFSPPHRFSLCRGPASPGRASSP